MWSIIRVSIATYPPTLLTSIKLVWVILDCLVGRSNRMMRVVRLVKVIRARRGAVIRVTTQTCTLVRVSQGIGVIQRRVVRVVRNMSRESSRHHTSLHRVIRVIPVIRVKA